MDNLYFKNQCNITLVIKANEISNNIHEILKKQLKTAVEGKCIREGYVRKGSATIVSRSPGRVLLNQFNGSLLYNVSYVADICNPTEGMIIKSTVINVNKMGILAYGGDDETSPLNILLAKQHHIDNEHFDKIQENDQIYITVVGVRKESGDTQISVIGKLMDQAEITIPKPDDGKGAGVDDNTINYYSKSKNYKWLSSFTIANPFNYKGVNYVSVEHALNAQKNMEPEYQALFNMDSETYIGNEPALAKKNGNVKKIGSNLVEGWDTNQVAIMRDITRIYLKTNPEIKEQLLNTGDKQLVYTGPSVDAFWGINKNKGANNHGKVLMELRNEFKIEM
jgi:ribA/ribD-fused uncharacterized protein